MKITIDLSGSDLVDDLAYINDAYYSLECLTCGDSHRLPDQINHVSNLLCILNKLNYELNSQTVSKPRAKLEAVSTQVLTSS